LQYEVEVSGRRLRVSVARKGSGFAVTVDGRTWHVDAARINAQTLSLLLDTSVSPRPQSRELVVAVDPATAQLAVSVGSLSLAVSLNGRRRGRREEIGAAGSGPQRIAAPMPGKVVRVLVEPGQAVRAREPVAVVEAMKMENELRAGRDGIVAEVPAREGMSVDAGALLVVIQ
jgi:biotin carboxyl carrier protein